MMGQKTPIKSVLRFTVLYPHEGPVSLEKAVEMKKVEYVKLSNNTVFCSRTDKTYKNLSATRCRGGREGVNGC